MQNWTKTNITTNKISNFDLNNKQLFYEINGLVGGTLLINQSNDSAGIFAGKSELLLKADKNIKLVNNNIFAVDESHTKQSLLRNSMLGSYAPFIKIFIIRGIGYQADIIENDLMDSAVKEFPYDRYLSLRVGHSYNLYIPIPNYIGIKVSHKDRKLIIYGANKEKVANFAKKVWKLRLPSVYTGRGIRIKKAMHRRKLGKKDIRKGKV